MVKAKDLYGAAAGIVGRQFWQGPDDVIADAGGGPEEGEGVEQVEKPKTDGTLILTNIDPVTSRLPELLVHSWSAWGTDCESGS